MLGLIQRVSEAGVTVEGKRVGEIGRGLLLLLGVQKHDDDSAVARLLDKVVCYRVFPDDKGHMNLSLEDVGGELLVVSQFTLAADTKKGLRPSFSSAADPELAERLYERFLEMA
ncbi:MAG: D-tyrosyl-tRNA(Tyr) deacylase, partial [Pseudomonadales bacterium]|nr:D-tyrosyl-tRNA(Tyr) deacylase [Pseudomonadales bacterium]